MPVDTPGPSRLTLARGLLIAPLGVALALGVRLALAPWLTEMTYLPFFVAVVVAAWFGGWWSGALAIVCSVLASLWFLVPPEHSFAIASIGEGVRIALFASASIAMVLICEALLRTRAGSRAHWAALRQANDEARVREQELHLALEAGRVSEARLSEQLSEQARAQHDLRESEERFRTLVATMPQLVFAARPNGEVFWFNERWYEYSGTTPDQMENGGWIRVHDPAMLPKVRKAWADGVAAGGPIQMTFPLRGADGKYRQFLTRVMPLKDDEGQVLQWLGTSTDVSELRALEEQLRDSDRRKDEFLATLAHELRNPLAPILTGLEVLKRSGGITPELDAIRSMMDRQVSHMARLLEDLLDVSRITRGTLELRKQHVDLATVLNAAIETSRPLVDARRHRLTLIPSFDTIEVEADPHRIAQVFSNLLNNAAKYSEPGGQILVTVEKQGYEVGVAIRDTGIGIAPSMITRVFEMFSQATPSLERTHGGLGIGLSLARQLVEMHGGTITASSDGVGKGAEFTVRLPVSVSANVAVPKMAVDLPNATQPLKILVADDNRDAAEALATMLQLQGDDVRIAYDGQAAVDLVRRFSPDVALLDIGMPRLNGYDACRRIRALPDGHRILCVALTGWGQDQDRRRSEEAGFNTHLVKPVSAETFEKLLAGARSSARSAAIA